LARLGKLTTRVAIVAMGRVALPAAALVTNMILARALSRVCLGRVQEVYVHFQILLNVLAVGIQTSLYNFLPRLEMPQRRTVIRRSVAIVFVVAAALSACIVAEADPLARWLGEPSSAPLVRAGSLALLCSLAATLADPLFIVHDRAQLSALTTVLGAGLQVACVASFVRGDAQAAFFFWAIAVGQLVRLVWGVAFAAKLASGEAAPPPQGFYRTQLAFLAPVILTSALDTVSSNLDRVLVARLFDASSMAVYVNGAVELPFIGILIGSLTAVLLPSLAEHLAGGRTAAAHELWKRAVSKSALILFGCFWLFLWVAEEIIVLLFSARYRESAVFFRIYLVLLPLRAIAFMPILYALGRAKTVFAGAVLDLVLNLLLSLMLVRATPLGMAGVAWGTVAATIVQCTFYLGAIRASLGVPWSTLLPWGELVRMFGFAAVWMLPLAGMRLLATPSWMRLAVAALLGATYGAFVVWPNVRGAEGEAQSKIGTLPE
jgi:O-antigen/teichoic acid export membrane protein